MGHHLGDGPARAARGAPEIVIGKVFDEGNEVAELSCQRVRFTTLHGVHHAQLGRLPKFERRSRSVQPSATAPLPVLSRFPEYA